MVRLHKFAANEKPKVNLIVIKHSLVLIERPEFGISG